MFSCEVSVWPLITLRDTCRQTSSIEPHTAVISVLNFTQQITHVRCKLFPQLCDFTLSFEAFFP